MTGIRTKHIRATIGYARGYVEQFGEDHGMGDLTADEVRTELDRMQAAGMKYVPSCDNIDAEGACIGHA